MRIIGGDLKNFSILTPKGLSTRPTTSKLREALFDICQDQIFSARFLDLFAGSGAIGLEALSRGAAAATFVESDPFAIRSLTDNIARLSLSDRANIVRGDVFQWLKQAAAISQGYHLVYADPPYDNLNLAFLIHELASCSVLAKGGTAFIELGYEKLREIPPLHGLVLKARRRYGCSELWQLEVPS